MIDINISVRTDSAEWQHIIMGFIEHFRIYYVANNDTEDARNICKARLIIKGQ